MIPATQRSTCGREGQIPDFLKIAHLPEIAGLPRVVALPKIACLPKIADLPKFSGLPKIACLPKIADLPRFASQDRSLFYTFLIEPRFQRNDEKDRERTIRSQETEEEERLLYHKSLTHIFLILRYFLAILCISDNKFQINFSKLSHEFPKTFM